MGKEYLKALSGRALAHRDRRAETEMHFAIEVSFFRIHLLSRFEPSRSKTQEL
jgi:hypothetical protein